MGKNVAVKMVKTQALRTLKFPQPCREKTEAQKKLEQKKSPIPAAPTDPKGPGVDLFHLHLFPSLPPRRNSRCAARTALAPNPSSTTTVILISLVLII